MKCRAYKNNNKAQSSGRATRASWKRRRREQRAKENLQDSLIFELYESFSAFFQTINFHFILLEHECEDEHDEEVGLEQQQPTTQQEIFLLLEMVCDVMVESPLFLILYPTTNFRSPEERSIQHTKLRESFRWSHYYCWGCLIFLHFTISILSRIFPAFMRMWGKTLVGWVG